jgi:hypothetical protein
MSLAALELNDQSLLLQAGDGAVHAQPGFARLTAAGIVCGEEARAVAWREPQHSYNQYWSLLNQAPLVARQKWARHHGDIAFAQLRQLWTQAGTPPELLLLAPGSLSDAQLSLLLGMASALPCQVTAIIDSALAACLEAPRPTLFVDLQLHQTVLSLCRPEADRMQLEDQEVYPELGLLQLHNTVARHISNLLIDSSRYDPLHASDSEQLIYDQLPHWLAQLCWKSEVSASIETGQGALPFILRQDLVRRLLEERVASMQSFCRRHAGSDLLLAHGSALLAGLTGVFADAAVATRGLACELALAHAPALLAESPGLQRLRSAPQALVADAPPQHNGRLATHVLHGHHALPLNTPLSIRLDNGQLKLANALDKDALLTVVLRRHKLETLHRAEQAEISLPEACQPGSSIGIAGHQLPLIEVRDG